VASKKKKKQRNRQRQASTTWSSSVPPAATEAGAISSPRPAPASTSVPAAKPYATGITGPRRAAGGTAAATGTIDIDARVPYFASDLRRVLVTASVMIVLIVAGSLLIK
jgi:hypothetical protein